MRSAIWGILIGLCVDATTARGGWVSGGGELTTDADNPWFLANTPSATYCVDIGPQFPYGAERLNAVIGEVLSYWRGEFKRVGKHLSHPQARIATQDFRLEDCAPTTDIHFQFGFLTPEQIAQIPQYKSFISLAVRTDYDQVNLRGKGFVYIAAEEGAFRPDSPVVVDHPWQLCDGCRLKRVLAHELGHIFGLPHVVGDELSLMAPEQPERMVRKAFAYEHFTEMPYFFSYAETFKFRSCFDPRFPQLFARVRRFFSLPAETNCVEFRHKDSNNLALLAATSPDGPFHAAGDFDVGGGSGESARVVRIHLTPAQRVFPAEALDETFVDGGTIETWRDDVRFQPAAAGGKSRHLIVNTTPQFVQIDGVMDGKLETQLLLVWHDY